MRRENLFRVLLSVIAVIAVSGTAAGIVHGEGAGEPCTPTRPDALGPFYKPDAPVRSRVGAGYVLSGVVRSSRDCSPVAEARIEFWLVNPEGSYDDDHRATLFADKKGSYRFESNFPVPYYSRPAHIHIRVSAEGYRSLITQHYPVQGETQGGLDLVLIPAR